MNLRKYSRAELETAVQTSVSVRQALQKLRVKAVGGNYRTFHKAVRCFRVSTAHFTGMNLGGRTLPPRKSIDTYLVADSDIQSHRLRKLLLKRGVLNAVCSDCGLVTWQGQPIPLELDHRNGDHRDNRLPNLRLLCPNCHALTPTYRGKNRSRSTR